VVASITTRDHEEEAAELSCWGGSLEHVNHEGVWLENYPEFNEG
jgi:hypothetical protein